MSYALSPDLLLFSINDSLTLRVSFLCTDFFSNYKHAFLLWPIALPQSSLSKSKLLNIIFHWPPPCLLLLKLFYPVPLISIHQNSFLQGHQSLICFSPQLISKYPRPYSCSAWTIYSIDMVSSSVPEHSSLLLPSSISPSHQLLKCGHDLEFTFCLFPSSHIPCNSAITPLFVYPRENMLPWKNWDINGYSSIIHNSQNV